MQCRGSPHRIGQRFGGVAVSNQRLQYHLPVRAGVSGNTGLCADGVRATATGVRTGSRHAHAPWGSGGHTAPAPAPAVWRPTGPPAARHRARVEYRPQRTRVVSPARVPSRTSTRALEWASRTHPVAAARFCNSAFRGAAPIGDHSAGGTQPAHAPTQTRRSTSPQKAARRAGLAS